MPTRGSGRSNRHGGGRGRLSVGVQPREGGGTSQNRAAGDRMVRPGPSPSRAVPSGRAEHDPFPNLPSRGGAGRGFDACGSTGPPPAAEPVPCKDLVALPPSAHPAVSYLDKLLGNISLKESSVAAISSPILVREPPDWYFTFYIRKDREGYFHTYPKTAGPFNSLEDADNGIDRHLQRLEDPKMSKESLDKLSISERAVRKALYFPDGTRKKCLEPLDETLDEIHLLVHALVDQYNDDRYLSGDLALQLKDVQRQQFFFSKRGSKRDLYYHFNFTAKTTGVVDSFFAEVKCKQGEDEEMVATCFCIVKPNDNGLCYGCHNNEARDMKHPSKADAYCRGQADEYMSCLGGYHSGKIFESVEEEEQRLRYQYECFDDPDFMAEHFPGCVKPMVKA